MASSEPKLPQDNRRPAPDSMASEEAARVQMQADGLWDSMKAPLADKHARLLEQARQEAAEKFGRLGPDAAPALRLAHSHFLLSRATEIAEGLGAPAPRSPKATP